MLPPEERVDSVSIDACLDAFGRSGAVANIQNDIAVSYNKRGLRLEPMAAFGIAIGAVTSAGLVGMGGLIALTFVMNTIIYMYVCYASAVYVPEMWPTSAKLSGSGFSNAMGRVSNVFFPFLVTALAAQSSSYVFTLLAVVAVIIAVCVFFLGVETRGESVESIGNIE